jgi:hypothetical protein
MRLLCPEPRPSGRGDAGGPQANTSAALFMLAPEGGTTPGE